MEPFFSPFLSADIIETARRIRDVKRGREEYDKYILQVLRILIKIDDRRSSKYPKK